MYQPAYAERAHVVALNKMDLEDARDLRLEVRGPFSPLASGRHASETHQASGVAAVAC